MLANIGRVSADPTEAVAELLRAAAGQPTGTAVEATVREVARLLPDARLNTATIADLVFRLRAGASERRWRERHVRDVLATTQQLLVSPAAEVALTEVIAAARRLVGSDIVHINYGFDELTHRRLVRRSEGEISEQWRDFPTQAGSGITGVVLQTDAPYVSEEYLDDTRIVRTEEAEERVRRDGIRTMAGVPIRRDGRCDGALLASWRTPTVVSADQIEDMGILAALAGGALQRAQRDERQRTTIAELEACIDRLAERAAALDRFRELTLSLSGVLARRGDLDQAIELVAAAFEARAALCGADGAPLHGTEPGFPPPGWTPPDAAGWTAPMQERQVVGCTVTVEGVAAAALVLDRPELDPDAAAALAQAANLCAVLAARDSLDDARVIRSHEHTITELVTPTATAATPAARLLTRSLRRSGGGTVAVIRLSDPGDPRLPRVRRLLAGPDGVAGEHDGRLVGIVPRPPDQVAAQLRGMLGDDPRDWQAGVDPIDSAAGVPDAHERARLCCGAVVRLTLTDPVAAAADLGFAGLLMCDPGPDSLGRFIDRTLGPVLRHDTDRDAQLLVTVEAYLGSAFSLQRTAATLHIHPNTAYKRLQRVSDLIGAGWQEPARLAEVQLALHLHRLLAPAGR